MSDVKAIIFWMSGVLTPSHSIVLEKSIYELTGKRIDTAVYHKNLSFFRQTSLGLISPEQFYQEVCKAIPTEMAPSILKEKIISLLSVDTQVIGIINRIPEKLEIRLLLIILMSGTDAFQVWNYCENISRRKRRLFYPDLVLRTLSTILWHHCQN